MKESVAIILGILLLLSACPAEAASFSGAEKGLPSLVMLSTPT